MIPFYGADRPDLFEIERSAMDRAGHVVAALDRRLPIRGRVADVGAGNGFTAQRLSTHARTVVAVEPEPAMLGAAPGVPAVVGMAQHLPLATGSMDGLYATWAYFFPSFHDIEPGLAEADRVVRPGGPICIVDNLGDDEFTALSQTDISTDSGYWRDRGFILEPIETSFEFESIDDARLLLELFFGQAGRAGAKPNLTFRVGLFWRESRGPLPPDLRSGRHSSGA